MDWAARDPAGVALQDAAAEAWLVKAGSSDRLWSRKPTDPHGSAVATWFRDSGIGADCLQELENLEQEGELGQFMLGVSQYKADGVEVGTAMALEGLGSSPDLNGQVVVVLAYLVERGRYQCEVLEGGRKLAVLAKRLRALTESEAAGAAGKMAERAAAERAELAWLAAALEQEELQKAEAEAEANDEDGGTVVTGGDVDWAAVDAGKDAGSRAVPTRAEMEPGERFVYETRYPAAPVNIHIT